mmetsp:Transcript_37902/g.113264  ORF Transcript_37902/g.113264 Transcript_37902/m.113264 type:complete len:649 (-) Transcript_37902:4-1950(-)
MVGGGCLWLHASFLNLVSILASRGTPSYRFERDVRFGLSLGRSVLRVDDRVPCLNLDLKECTWLRGFRRGASEVAPSFGEIGSTWDESFVNRRAAVASSHIRHSSLSPGDKESIYLTRNPSGIDKDEVYNLSGRTDERTQSDSTVSGGGHPFSTSSISREQTPDLPEYGWPDESQDNGPRWRISAQPSDIDDESKSDEDASFRNFIDSRSNGKNRPCLQNDMPTPESRPIVYQFFGKSLRRSRQSDAVQLVILGPSVDHWRSVGRILSSRGFNVMACQRITGERDPAGGEEDSVDSVVRRGDGEALVLKILDALRWERAVIVGCGSEAALAVDAALSLAPERVAGVVLCGDLTSVESFAEELKAPSPQLLDQFLPCIDTFVEENLSCPCTIIWDGDLFTLPSFEGKHSPGRKSYESFNKIRRMVERHRALIIGGGSSPHRRLPDQFAWVLTRFVEQQVVAHTRETQVDLSDSGDYEGDRNTLDGTFSGINLGRDMQPANPFRDDGPVDQFFSSGSFLVTGRYVARMLLYFSVFKVVLHQYQNLKTGLSFIQSSVSAVNSWQKRGREFASSVLAFGWIRKHLSFKRMRWREQDKCQGKKELSNDHDVSENQNFDSSGESEDSRKRGKSEPGLEDLFYDHRLILIDGVIT